MVPYTGIGRFLPLLTVLILSCSPSMILGAIPALSTSLDTEQTRVGEPFSLHVEIRWEGPLDQFVHYPPTLNLPEGITSGRMKQRFESQSDETIYQYDYQLVSKITGVQNLGTIQVDYRDLTGQNPTDEDRPPPLEIEGPSIEVLEGGLHGLLARILAPTLGIIVLSLLFLWQRRSAAPRQKRDSTPASEDSATLLLRAKQQLTDGSYDAFFQTLIQLKALLSPVDDPLPSVEKLEQEHMRMRYSGVTGAREDLERLLRPVELLLRPPRE